MRAKIKITPDELKELNELVEKAQNTPMIKMRSDMPSMAETAWERVREKMDALGQKYGYDPAKHAINQEGEVVPYEQKQDPGGVAS